jgi:hypothetical protein
MRMKALRRVLANRLDQGNGNAPSVSRARQLSAKGRIALGSLAATLSVTCLLLFIPTIHAFSGQDPAYSTDKSAQEAQRKQYAEKVGQSYNFAFGKGKLSVPGNGAVEGNTFLQPDAFPNASYCGHCHQEAYHQWQQSLHRNSFRTPFYRASVNILLNTKGIQFTRHCDSCHNPIAVLAGGLTQESVVDRKFDQDGLTCMTCHSIQQVQSTLGNGGYVMGVPAVLVDEKGNRMPGIPPDSEILAHLDRHSKAVMQDLLHKRPSSAPHATRPTCPRR